MNDAKVCKSHRALHMPKLIILSLPFLLWIISFLNFYPGNIVLYADAERNFIYTNFFFDQLARGVFPMWNPFHQWGSPDDFGVRVIGEFNPLLYLAFLFHKLGLSMPLSFYLYLLIYFLIGMIGFYLLANRLFDDKRMPLAALILFMFSSIGTNLFNDILVILTLVPSIWFFYFLVKFTKRLDKNSFLGIIYSLMTIAITYLPLYFLTGFLTFLIFFALFYSRDMIGIVKRYFLFARENKFLVSISMFLLGLSIIPGLLWFLAAGMGEYITSWRSFHGEGANAAAMEVGTINLSSLAGPNSFTGLFSNLHYLHAGSIYIPLAVVVIFLLGALVKINRRLLLYLSVSFTIFLISLADVTPVHHFLYTYVPYFKFFRNTHFLFWFAYPFFVLFVVEQLQNLLRLDLTRRWEKGAMLFYVFVVHVGLWLFLLSQDHVINSSYMSVFLSLIFFVTCSSSNFRVPRWAWLLLLGATLIQPLEVFYHLGQIVKDQPSRSAAEVGSAAESKPQFVFFRPKKGEDAALIDHQGLGDSRDTSGFVEGDYVGIKSSYLLQKEIPEDILKEYVRYKILVYDNAARLNGDARDFSLIASAMSGQSNVALVSNDDAHALPEHFNQENNPHPLAITADSLEFQVLAFDLNDIKFKTNFSSDKFLVYNDSFHNDWQARVNGQPVKIFKVNGAFKGLWIRAGENVVYLRFRSETRYLFNFVLLFIFAAFFFYLILDSLGQRKLEKT